MSDNAARYQIPPCIGERDRHQINHRGYAGYAAELGKIAGKAIRHIHRRAGIAANDLRQRNARLRHAIAVPRNHLVEEALAAATDGDLAPFDRLLEAVSAPYDERPGLDRYAEPAPDSFGAYTTFCGT